MKELSIAQGIESQHKDIIKLLLYFDIFDYPLKLEELNLATSKDFDVTEAINELKKFNIVEEQEGYYYLTGKNYDKRIRLHSTSEKYFRKAKRYAKLIYRFPFVRGVYISGSLSKDWADDNTDVDYFIITSPSRLWVCRTMLVMFKKVFLLNSRKYFCLNYFIDEDNLEIRNKNIFTAMEVSFLKPMINKPLFGEFKDKNHWVDEYFNGEHLDDDQYAMDRNHTIMKRMGEEILKGKLGEQLDIWCMKRTLNHWRDKFPEMKKEDFEINFKTDRSISKHHPSGFQMKVLDAFDQKVKEFEDQYQLSLS